MSLRRQAGGFDGPLGAVRYVSIACCHDRHGHCASGARRRRGEIACSCECHVPEFIAAHTLRTTPCQLAQHGECLGHLMLEIPGRREHIRKPCDCVCHMGETYRRREAA